MLEQILGYGALFFGLVILGSISLSLLWDGLADLAREWRDQWKEGGL